MSPVEYGEQHNETDELEYLDDNIPDDVKQFIQFPCITRKEFVNSGRSLIKSLREFTDELEKNLNCEIEEYTAAKNINTLFATTRLITWANRAKRKVEREYSPTKKRGRQCIEEYENEFHNDDLKNKMTNNTTISQSK